MTRKLKNLKTGEIFECTEHIILKNFWEYYVLNAKTNTPDTKLCLVCGFEEEIGDVWLPELTPFVISRTKNLNEILAPRHYDWVN